MESYQVIKRINHSNIVEKQMHLKGDFFLKKSLLKRRMFSKLLQETFASN
jgi:hypothetical protein